MPRLKMLRLLPCDGCLGYSTWHRNFASTANPRWTCRGCGDVKVFAQDPEQEKVVAAATKPSQTPTEDA